MQQPPRARTRRRALFSAVASSLVVCVWQLLTRGCSTNPHFGVFLPPVALVGDPTGTPVPIRLQVNQVRVFVCVRACVCVCVFACVCVGVRAC